MALKIRRDGRNTAYSVAYFHRTYTENRSSFSHGFQHAEVTLKPDDRYSGPELTITVQRHKEDSGSWSEWYGAKFEMSVSGCHDLSILTSLIGKIRKSLSETFPVGIRCELARMTMALSALKIAPHMSESDGTHWAPSYRGR